MQVSRQTTLRIGITAALLCKQFNSLTGDEELGPLACLGVATRARPSTQDHTRI
jgi:hypothetical protein